MASWFDDYEWQPASYFNETEADLFSDFVDIDARLADDEMAQVLFHGAMFDFELTAMDRDYMYQALLDYMSEEYDLDFAAEFDWEDYREWYEGE